MARTQPGPTLERALGFWQVTASGVGIIIGAGIYVLVGEATTEAGSAVWAAFLLAAVLSAFTGLGYAELASMYPKAGGEFEFSRHVFPASISFVTGWVMIAALCVASGAVSLGFASYLNEFFAVDRRLAAFALLAVLTLIALGGIKNSARITIVLSAVQVGGLLFVIAVGAPHVGDVDLWEGATAGGILGGAALVFFAFIGFDEVISLAEETHSPSRTVPRALLAALGISTVLYVAVAIVSVSVLGVERLGASDRPVAAVAGESTGDAGMWLIAVAALISTANTTLLAITSASRVTYAMAKDGALPPRFAVISGRTRVPASAIVATSLVALGFAALKDLSLIAQVTDAAVYLVFLVVNAAVIALRYRAPGTARPFRMPLSVGRFPVLAGLGFLVTAVMLTQLDLTSLALTGVVLGLGLAAYLRFARKRWVYRPDATG